MIIEISVQIKNPILGDETWLEGTLPWSHEELVKQIESQMGVDCEDDICEVIAISQDLGIGCKGADVLDLNDCLEFINEMDEEDQEILLGGLQKRTFSVAELNRFIDNHYLKKASVFEGDWWTLRYL